MVKLKLYQAKIDDGLHGIGLSEQLEKYITQNITANKKLASQAMLLRGRLFVKLGEIDEARKVYEAYKKGNPKADDMPEVLYYIGYAYLIQGDFEQANSSFDAILKDFPKTKNKGIFQITDNGVNLLNKNRNEIKKEINFLIKKKKKSSKK